MADFDGTVTAGEDATILSQAGINGSVTAGADLHLSAQGDILGNHTAGRDASADIYGSFNAALHADQDILSLWSRGDLSGGKRGRSSLLESFRWHSSGNFFC